jgi:hypothetical protein
VPAFVELCPLFKINKFATVELLRTILLLPGLLTGMCTKFTRRRARYFDIRDVKKAGINQPLSQTYVLLELFKEIGGR